MDVFAFAEETRVLCQVKRPLIPPSFPHLLPGIGKETALDLARRGARVFLACRSEERTLPVVEEIRTATGNEQVFFKKLDLARITSIRAFAEDFVDEEEVCLLARLLIFSSDLFFKFFFLSIVFHYISFRYILFSFV